MFTVLLLALFALCVPTASRADVLTDIGDRLTHRVAEAFVRSFPVIAASAGVTYRFDPVTGAFEREAAMVGQLFLERAEPIGRDHWNFGVSYQRVALESIEGKDADALHDSIPIALVNDNLEVVGLATFDRMSIEAVTHVATLSLTYGVTDAADVNVTVPVIVSDLKTEVMVSALNVATGESATGTARDSETSAGFGDVILRGRYRLFELEPVKVAGGLVLRFPSGEVDSLRGTGTYEIAPLLYASTRAWRPLPWARLTAYLNGGVDLVADDVDASEGRWGVGLDWGITDGATIGLSVLGRHPFKRLASPGFFDVVRVLPGPRLGTAPLFGIEGERPDYYDFSAGGRVNIWRDTVIAFANAVVPLNDAGIRTGVIPLVGLEAAF